MRIFLGVSESWQLLIQVGFIFQFRAFFEATSALGVGDINPFRTGDAGLLGPLAGTGAESQDVLDVHGIVASGAVHARAVAVLPRLGVEQVPEGFRGLLSAAVLRELDPDVFEPVLDAVVQGRAAAARWEVCLGLVPELENRGDAVHAVLVAAIDHPTAARLHMITPRGRPAGGRYRQFPKAHVTPLQSFVDFGAGPRLFDTGRR